MVGSAMSGRSQGRGLGFIAFIPILIAVGLVGAPTPSFAKTFTLRIDGDAGASFLGSCLAEKGGTHEVLALSGHVPFTQTVEAEFMSCRINASGRIAVEATSDSGQQRTAETRSGMITLSLR
jgi:hypothetical protein